MTGISRVDKLNLFKRLIKYSNQLVYTDKQFYLDRVKQEFNKNKSLNDEKDIKFFYQVSIIFNVFLYLTHVLRNGIQLQLIWFLFTERTYVSQQKEINLIIVI